MSTPPTSTGISSPVAYISWTLLLILAICTVPPYLDSIHPGGQGQGMSAFGSLLEIGFYGYVSIALFYVVKIGIHKSFFSLVNILILLGLLGVQGKYWFDKYTQLGGNVSTRRVAGPADIRTVKQFYSNRRLESIRVYRNALSPDVWVRDSIWTYYDRDGEVIRRVRYR